jgi:hypothetical protein
VSARRERIPADPARNLGWPAEVDRVGVPTLPHWGWGEAPPYRPG